MLTTLVVFLLFIKVVPTLAMAFGFMGVLAYAVIAYYILPFATVATVVHYNEVKENT